MAKNITRHVQHIKSVDTTTITVDGQDVIVAKLPEWGDLKDGEIAVNYKDGYETISIRNNNNEVVAFPNINTVNTLIDEKAQAALTFDSTPTANSVNPVTSDGIKTYVDNGDKIQALTTYQSSTPLAVGDTHDQALSKLSKIIDDNEIITARALTDLNDTKQDEIEDLDVIRTGAALGATALQTETQLSKGTTTGSGNAVTDISVDNHQITLTKGATFLTEHQDLSAYADGAEYDSVNHLIYLKHGNTRLANPINAADFIKDGMVNSVRIGVLDDSSDDETRYLIVTFNTDAGLEDIKIPLTDIFDPSLYYTKEEIDEHELVTAAALTELHDTKQDKLDFDDTPTADSTNPVTSGGIKSYVDTTIGSLGNIVELNEPTVSTPLAINDSYDDAFAKLSKIIRDNELATAGALTELHNTKQELLTFDSTPTANSQNPVTSEGIKEYVDDAIDASTPMTEITYSDLVTARNNNNLKPGTWYRITDYTTTTTQADTQSAGHNFDIIVLATSSNTLSEEARAIKHDGDTYFANSNLNAWKVWYCLDNNKVKYNWADDSVDESTEESITATVQGGGGAPTSHYNCIRDMSKDRTYQGQDYYGWGWVQDSSSFTFYTKTENISIGEGTYTIAGGGAPASSYGVITAYTPAHEGTGLPNGRGVIYRLIDEWNNDVPYDFKNIQFKRKLTDGQYDPTNGTDTWVYTFDAYIVDTHSDNSLGFNLSTIGGSGMVTLCHHNIIKPCSDITNYQNIIAGTAGEFVLNDTVFLNICYNLNNPTSLIVERNVFDVNSHINTLIMISNNVFGMNFNNNVLNGFGSISYNSFGHNCNNCKFYDMSNSVIGNDVNHVNFAIDLTDGYAEHCIIEDGVEYVTVSNGTGAQLYLRDITILRGVRGTSSSYKTLSITSNMVDNGGTTPIVYQPSNRNIVSV